jgi:O-antigen ligase
MHKSKIYRKKSIKNNVKSFIFFILFFVIFFLYIKTAVYDNITILLLLNTMILAVFLLSIYKIKSGFYLFVFLIPLLNSLTAILHVQKIDIILFLFFSFFLGFYINIHINNIAGNHSNVTESIKSRLFYYHGISRPILIFMIFSFISCLITIFRYSNFYPFITHNYYDLMVNINGLGSTWSILWTAQYFLNYIIGFLLFFIIFYILDDIKDIIRTIIILLFSNFIFTIIGFYQYFFDPGFGNTGEWAFNRINATFSDPNALGSYIVILFPIYIAVIIFCKRWYLKTLFILLLSSFLAIAGFCGSRSALLGIILSLFAFSIIGLVKLIKVIVIRSRSSIKLKRLFTALAVILLIIIILFCSVFITFCASRTELKDIYRPETNIALANRVLNTIWVSYNVYRQEGIIEGLNSISQERFVLWGQSLAMFKDFPISGVGVGSFVIELPDYFVKSFGEVKTVDFVGNYYLQILSELGIAGLLLMLFIFYYIIRKVFSYFRDQRRIKKINRDGWLLAGLFISFITMVIILILGPHTNFNEIQLTFWLIIGLMISYVRIKDKENTKTVSVGLVSMPEDVDSYKVLQSGTFRNRFSLTQRISFIVIILIFTGSILNSSFSNLSINGKQDIYSWENSYGFYDDEIIDGKKYRWTSIDASEVIRKEGRTMIVPLRAGNPDISKDDIFIRLYIDNSLVRILRLRDHNWHEAEINISGIDKKNITFTISSSRSWSPKEYDLSNDTRELGVMIGEIRFIDDR